MVRSVTAPSPRPGRPACPRSTGPSGSVRHQRSSTGTLELLCSLERLHAVHAGSHRSTLSCDQTYRPFTHICLLGVLVFNLYQRLLSGAITTCQLLDKHL